jgi:hypothetical protein
MKKENKKLSFRNLVEASGYLNEETLESCRTHADIEEIFRKDSDFLNEQWKKSEYTDFSVYQGKNYLSELFLCYKHVSKSSVCNAIKYLKENVPNWKELSYFEDYNGLGLTTSHLLEEGLNVNYFNDVKEQSDSFKRTAEKLGYDISQCKNDLDKSGKYDVVFTMENIEHFKEPLEYMKTMTSMCKGPGSYLVYSSGFSLNDIYCGHFPTYNIDGKECSIRAASLRIGKYLKEQNFQIVFQGFNGKPRIYVKR